MAKLASAIRVPGNWSLFVAPPGTTEPTDTQEALDPSWVELGYTDEDGVGTAPSRELGKIKVGQSLHAVREVLLSEDYALTCVLSEYKRAVVETAFGATVTETTAGSGEFKIEPATDGSIKEQALLLEIEDGDTKIRKIVRRTVVRSLDEVRVKRGTEMGIGCTFGVVAEDGVAPWLDLTNAAAMASA